jgi:hypothetical protein
MLVRYAVLKNPIARTFCNSNGAPALKLEWDVQLTSVCMLSNSTTAMAVWEAANGTTVEYSPAVVDEVRRLAVDGFMAFGHGGLEVGGVLYGARDGNRVSVLASAELPCEHALGPGFALSGNDRQTLARLLEPPDGLQTVGWYRAHTRKSLDLDVSDRDLFNQFLAKEKIIGLVLKPTHRGPSWAALYLRETTGEILPSAPREFTIEPLGRQAGVPVEPEPVAEAEASTALAIAAEPEAPVVIVSDQAVVASIHRNGVPQLPFRRPRYRLRRAALAAVMLGIAAAAVYYWSRPSRNLELEAYAIAPGQVRIEWNHRSLPIVDAATAVLQIRDGESVATIPLDANQLRSSSITYEQSSGHITVRLRVERRQRGAAAAEESIEFVGPAEPRAATAVAETPAVAKDAPPLDTAAPPIPFEALATAPAQSRTEVRDQVRNDVRDHVQNDQRNRQPVELPKERTPSEAAAPVGKREFRVSLPQRNTPPPAVLLAPPPAPAVATGEPVLPDFLPQAPAAPKPISRPYSGPRSGRLIWTGELGRRGVVEIEGARASIGTLTGSLSGVPVVVRVWPAEFTRDGLAVYTGNTAERGRKEPPSKATGWNPVNFQFDPVRAQELVVLEAPNRVNDFNRLVLRNDARACPIIVVDWTVQ